MKRITYIILLIALFLVSCTADEWYVDVNVAKPNHVQLVTRFLPFTEQDVATRAEAESMIDYIIFGTDSNGGKVCVYYNHTSNDIINIDRANDFSTVANKELLKQCDIYVLANYPAIYEKIIAEAGAAGATDVVDYIKNNIVGKKTGEYFTSIPMDVSPIVNIPESALPRYGYYATSVNLTSGSDNDIPSGTTYTVDLTSLYAKMVFTINVDPTEKNPNILDSNTFQLAEYTVNNLPTSVDLITAAHDNVAVHANPVVGELSAEDISNKTFTFYVPERYFKSKTSVDEFVYPFGQGSAIRDEDLDLRQRYKPLLAKGYSSYNGTYSEGNDDKATYVTISGVFTNHQGHTYDVAYDVYLGNDHFGNFDVKRNTQYNNTITIKGIHNSSDQSSSADAVSIDHRVNISRTQPLIISLRRELLLDAHFEVRPMRIRKNANHHLDEGETAPTHVKVEVIYDPNADNGFGNWIGLERSFGDGKPVTSSSLYCVGTSSSAGKRKYFTYDLVDPTLTAKVGTGKETKPLHNSTIVYVPIPENSDDNECVWIYVDECTAASKAKDAKRSATIRVTYGTGNSDATFKSSGQPINYTINQHKLFEVTYDNRTYHIEHEEEYLHNFDAETAYGDESNKTEFQGMEWGLENIQLSNLYPAVNIDFPSSLINIIEQIFGGKSTKEKINEALVKEGFNPKYDFYMTRDIDDEDLKRRDFSGHTFNTEIVSYIKSKLQNNDEAKIEGITLAEAPKSAFAYCYNRNKRNSNGDVVSLDWYMPAIDELEDIMETAYLYFTDFQGQFYWSCQPSYKDYQMTINYVQEKWFSSDQTGVIEGHFFADDTERARATRVKVNVATGLFEELISSSADVIGVQEGDLTIPVLGEPNFKIGKYEPVANFDDEYKNHPGNKPRTEKCRVRAVRKIN